MTTFAITGTRKAEVRTETELEALFRRFVGPFADPAAHAYLGGAAGIDTLALSWLARNTESLITVAVPVRVAEQPRPAQVEIAAAARAGRLHELVELGHPAGLGDAAYNARNRWLVDRAELLIGFPLTTEDDGSGTWYTLGYAARQGIPRLIVSLAHS
ncbi:MAG: hypothetical protein MJE77_06995 [Proteobacteria bacterium]|nr:hypothetical protein [Pseudomonadota bacterium]